MATSVEELDATVRTFYEGKGEAVSDTDVPLVAQANIHASSENKHKPHFSRYANLGGERYPVPCSY